MKAASIPVYCQDIGEADMLVIHSLQRLSRRASASREQKSPPSAGEDAVLAPPRAIFFMDLSRSGFTCALILAGR